jgi:hypothetical protein
VQVKSDLQGDIAKVTVDLLLSWMEVGKAPSSVKDGQEDFLADLLRYVSVTEIDSIENEQDKSTFPYFSTQMWMYFYGNENVSKVKLTTDVMREYVPRKTPLCQTLPKKSHLSSTVSLIQKCILALSLALHWTSPTNGMITHTMGPTGLSHI